MLKEILKNLFTQDKQTLLSLSFNENHLFYDEPQNFEDYFDLVKDLSTKQIEQIIKDFNNY